MVLSFDRWVGKVAVVSGASAGIGAKIVEDLVNKGLKVVGVARRSSKIEEIAKKLSGKKGKLYAFKADFTKESDILKTFEWTSKNVGPVSILINNAGVLPESNLFDATTETMAKVLELNVLGLSIATREAIKIMKDNNINGDIIHINSIAGHYCINCPGLGIYNGSKHAVTALTETLRQELVRIGTKIKISSISPGGVESEMTIHNPNNTPERLEMLKKTPILQPEDISDGVLYVLSTPEHVQLVLLSLPLPSRLCQVPTIPIVVHHDQTNNLVPTTMLYIKVAHGPQKMNIRKRTSFYLAL